jgi:hypothetical protein
VSETSGTFAFRVHPDKIQKYLLSTHTLAASGKSKFFTQIGYTLANWRRLEQALLLHPHVAALEVTIDDIYGPKETYRCNLPPAPDSKQYCVRSVWQLRGGIKWFVTAIPYDDLSQ